MTNIAVLGYGTVGSGIVEVINTNKKIVDQKSGSDLHVKWVLDLREFEGDPVREILTHDFNDILNDDSVSIICEAMGGVKPAYDFTKSALLKGKSVCTSNKELVAAHGAELIQIAKENNCNYFFEAAVGGGIPIIRPLLNCLTADDIKEVTGILNGTTNYILTKMSKEGLAFDTVLKSAQENGYAERNPEADIEGYDACRKIAILASLVAGAQVDYNDIYTEGITKITTDDFAFASSMKAEIKIFGTYKKLADDKKVAYVAPMMIDASNPLYSVSDVFNGILVKSNMLDQVMFYGRGAGKLPTASAVVSDVVEAARLKDEHFNIAWDANKVTLSDFNEVENKFFVRLSKADATIDQVKAALDVACVIDDVVDGQFAVITNPTKEGAFKTATSSLQGILSVIRVGF